MPEGDGGHICEEKETPEGVSHLTLSFAGTAGLGIDALSVE